LVLGRAYGGVLLVEDELGELHRGAPQLHAGSDEDLHVLVELGDLAERLAVDVVIDDAGDPE
jgi:hypothetical protein